jgi:hypothetical protein
MIEKRTLKIGGSYGDKYDVPEEMDNATLSSFIQTFLAITGDNLPIPSAEEMAKIGAELDKEGF